MIFSFKNYKIKLKNNNLNKVIKIYNNFGKFQLINIRFMLIKSCEIFVIFNSALN